MHNIPWEKTADGLPAQHKMGYRPVTKNLFVVKQAALSKMTNVSLLSAEFRGDIVVFEPRIAVLLDMNTHAEFMGLYQSRPNEEEPDTAPAPLPSLALRKARWVRADDFKQFNMATNKRAYIDSEEQVHSRIIFTQLELHPEIVRLLEDAKNMAHMGIKVEPAHRPDSQRGEIQFHIEDETISLRIAYMPHIQQSSLLEMWIDQWVRSFEQVDFSGGTLPDHGCAISYTKSFLDYLSMF